MTDLEIRDSLEEDIDDFCDIEQASFTAPWSRDSLDSMVGVPSVLTLTALSGDAVVGYVYAYVVEEDCDILNLAVSPEVRRRGVATALLDEVFARAKADGARAAFLEVRESNEGAISLYEKAGFEAVGKRKNYYRNPVEDALIMEKYLD